MNTPAHLLIGAAAFARPARGRILAAALIGAVLPDLSLYLMAGISLHVLNIPPGVVFDQLYFSPAWQTVFAIDNSFVLWALALMVGLWRGWPVLVAGAGAGLLHLGMDFLLHAGDGRPQFWPFSNWVFHSPVSYWDKSHHAMWVAPVAALACLASFVTLLRRGLTPGATMFCAVLLLAELWTARQWILFF